MRTLTITRSSACAPTIWLGTEPFWRFHTTSTAFRARGVRRYAR
jgi:hypothetical protein